MGLDRARFYSVSILPVVGFDVSEAQIAQAKLKCTEDAAVGFEVGNAHHLQFESSSIDLLTCATA